MRKALVVGINHYLHSASLHGCVDDAHAVKEVFKRHGDGTVNFDVRLMTGTGPSDLVSKEDLKEAVRELFEGDSDIALLYFAGHGYIEATGSYLLPCESKTGDDGFPLNDVLTLAINSKAKNKMLLLDCCHSGAAGSIPYAPNRSELSEGMTILTASTAEQYADENADGGVFTTLLVDALRGGAANLVGEVTPGSVYAHIDQSLGSWKQRPVFKTNVKSFVSLRKVTPPIELAHLQQIAKLFPSPGYQFQLDPSYEPERTPTATDTSIPAPDPENTRTFAILQKYNRVNLLVPVNAPHMYHAAMTSKSCKLTVLGEHYRRLVEEDRL